MVRFTVDNRNRLIFYGNPVGYVKADRGTPENAAKFIAAQDALIEELYAEPEPENSGETAEGTESKESEGAEPSAESEATE